MAPAAAKEPAKAEVVARMAKVLVRNVGMGQYVPGGRRT